MNNDFIPPTEEESERARHELGAILRKRTLGLWNEWLSPPELPELPAALFQLTGSLYPWGGRGHAECPSLPDTPCHARTWFDVINCRMVVTVWLDAPPPVGDAEEAVDVVKATDYAKAARPPRPDGAIDVIVRNFAGEVFYIVPGRPLIINGPKDERLTEFYDNDVVRLERLQAAVAADEEIAHKGLQ